MKTIDIADLPPEIANDLIAGETIQILHGDTIAGTIQPGDPFAIVEKMRELFKDVPEEEIQREVDRILVRDRMLAR